MPSNYTEHYQLSQWEKSDKVLMDDFNADNAKLDAALKAQAGALAEEAAAREALAGQLAQRGDCQLYLTSYTGNGQYGSGASRTLSFPKQPHAVLICGSKNSMFMVRGASGAMIFTGSGCMQASVSWNGSSVTWSAPVSNGAHMLNESGVTYQVLALLKA